MVSFNPMSEYLKDAERITLNVLGDCWSARRIVNDDDYLATIATSIMKADNNFDESRKTSIRTLRFEYAKNEILNIVSRMKKNRRFITNSDFIKIAKDKGSRPIPYGENPMDTAKYILSEREYSIIENYYVNKYTFEEIAEQSGITKQRVHQIYQKAIEKLQDERAKFV